MKIEWNKKYNTIAVYVLLVIVAGASFIYLLQNFKGFSDYTSRVIAFLMPFIYGFVIAYILNPILRMFDQKLMPENIKVKMKPNLRRMLSILLTYIVAFLFLVLFFSFVIPEITASVSGIVSKFPVYLRQAELWLTETLQAIEMWGINDSAVDTVLKAVVNSFDGWMTEAYNVLKSAIPQVLNTTVSTTIHFADILMNLVLGVIISVYLLMSKEKFFAQLKKFLYAIFPAKAVERSVYITHKSHVTFSGFINGKLLDSLIIGILCFIGMWLMRMPNAMLISVIVGITNVIPYFGPFIGAIPGAIIILLTDPVKTIWFLIFILALQQFDGNILGPKILGETTGISAFWVIFAIVVFSSLLGVVGMFIGVPLFAVIYTLIREYVDIHLEKKGLPVKTSAYASDEHKIEF